MEINENRNLSHIIILLISNQRWFSWSFRKLALFSQRAGFYSHSCWAAVSQSAVCFFNLFFVLLVISLPESWWWMEISLYVDCETSNIIFHIKLIISFSFWTNFSTFHVFVLVNPFFIFHWNNEFNSFCRTCILK